MDLTPRQKRILSALINSYRQTDHPIKGSDLAEEVNRNSGTVRNHMQNLKALQLVEGVPGPNGGYKPTTKAYETLNIGQIDDPTTVRLKHNSNIVSDVRVEEVSLSNAHHPNLCRAKIHVQGSVRKFQQDDTIVVGPTPLCRLQIAGRIDGIDEMNNILVLRVNNMVAPVEEESQ